MENRKAIFAALRVKLEQAGFQFEREQKPHHQKRKEYEFVFEHPILARKLELNGHKVNARKFYIKPLTDDINCEIGLVTGKSSPIYKLNGFTQPNSLDSFDQTPAWSNRENDKAIDRLLNEICLFVNSPSTILYESINTFLFAWNPTKWQWADLKENIDYLDKVGCLESRWSCGKSKKIKKGDRIFLVRLGEEPKGLMGSGYAKSSCYLAPHWNGKNGEFTNYVDIEFDILIDPDSQKIFGKGLLEKIDPRGLQNWFPQQSGINIKHEIVGELESNWFHFITKNNIFGKSFVSNDVISEFNNFYTEGKSKEVLQTRYERNPQARKICLAFHGYACQICDFNFEYFFGEIGKGFIHVHHINPIATIRGEYKIDPRNDLIPVCPNCHAMIHSKLPAFTIDEIRSIRKNNN
jgi:5-methylcytosine-specific restriction protein A